MWFEPMVFHRMPSVWWSPSLSDTPSGLLACDQRSTMAWHHLLLHMLQYETLLTLLAWSIVCGAGSMKLSSVFLSIHPITRTPHAAAAGLLLWARQPGDIDQLLHGRRSAANASSVTSAD